MRNRISLFSILTICIYGLLFYLNSCENNKNDLRSYYTESPKLIESKIIISGSDTLRPVRLQLIKDSLYISYDKRPFIDIYNLKFEKISTIHLVSPEEVYPTSFYVSDSNIFVADHSKGALVIYSRAGKFIQSFGLHPDGNTRLSPYALMHYGGVLYVSDINQKAVLAISTVNVENLTEIGELILTIPNDSLYPINFGSAIYVTFDGRLFAGDAVSGITKVYTCDGHFIYNFDTVPYLSKIAPQAIDLDNLIDSDLKMLDSNSFDPSGIRDMGRIHLVDANNAKVHMFNPLGRYIASYPEDPILLKPSGIAIDRKKRNIYIADPASKIIQIFKY